MVKLNLNKEAYKRLLAVRRYNGTQYTLSEMILHYLPEEHTYDDGGKE